ncbi:hypothetical protein trd_0499 [Thermomicrobium roseum DSM 5159]|uniref:Uncharacterized protein n=1 Tax=Thermomicrobium roseum (strain ATCC 27502 / DSM 5159 / P-2) TaxID=309801 RepID=B9KYF4_THERP|nr:hypothetical protein trd_0499 [Thermomicrobium roseum DSM 5159]
MTRPQREKSRFHADHASLPISDELWFPRPTTVATRAPPYSARVADVHLVGRHNAETGSSLPARLSVKKTTGLRKIHRGTRSRTRHRERPAGNWSLC